MVDSGSLGDILCCHFGTDVGIVTYIELADPNGNTGRGDKRTREINLGEGVKPRIGPRTDRIGVKLANGRHCVLQEM